jgi:hypothetical protein
LGKKLQKSETTTSERASQRRYVVEFSDNYVEIGLSVVVDRGRGSTTTNHEGLAMMVTCNTKQVNKVIRTELEVVVQRCRESDCYF